MRAERQIDGGDGGISLGHEAIVWAKLRSPLDQERRPDGLRFRKVNWPAERAGSDALSTTAANRCRTAREAPVRPGGRRKSASGSSMKWWRMARRRRWRE